MKSYFTNSSNLHELEELIIQKLVRDAQLSGYDGLILESISKSEHLSAINSHNAYDLNFPIILVDKDLHHIKDGVLGDLAPTILKLMGLKKPKVMTQDSLI